MGTGKMRQKNDWLGWHLDKDRMEKKESQKYTHINKRMKMLLDIANVFRLHFIW